MQNKITKVNSTTSICDINNKDVKEEIRYS